MFGSTALSWALAVFPFFNPIHTCTLGFVLVIIIRPEVKTFYYTYMVVLVSIYKKKEKRKAYGS
jgi:hypothetical protein